MFKKNASLKNQNTVLFNSCGIFCKRKLFFPISNNFIDKKYGQWSDHQKNLG